jgi:hypothetical protein
LIHPDTGLTQYVSLPSWKTNTNIKVLREAIYLLTCFITFNTVVWQSTLTAMTLTTLPHTPNLFEHKTRLFCTVLILQNHMLLTSYTPNNTLASVSHSSAVNIFETAYCNKSSNEQYVPASFQQAKFERSGCPQTMTVRHENSTTCMKFLNMPYFVK